MSVQVDGYWLSQSKVAMVLQFHYLSSCPALVLGAVLSPLGLSPFEHDALVAALQREAEGQKNTQEPQSRTKILPCSDS